jgi:tRNA(Arg) A34 adenosine deaminase TadA
MDPKRDILSIHLPEWFSEFLASQGNTLSSQTERMAFAVELSRRNVEHDTGSPFGAVLCSTETGKIISAGVNIVTAAHCSIAHAEMLALTLG